MAVDEEYTVLLALEARDAASRAVEGADALIQRLTGHSQMAAAQLEHMSGIMKTVGLLGAGLALGVAGFFGTAEHAAIGLQDALTTIQVDAHLTEDATHSMGIAIEQAAIGTTSSATDMAKALGPVAGELKRIQGGELAAADATLVLTAAQHLLVSSGGSLESNTKTLADLMLVYHLHASDAATISDTLYQAHAQLGVGVDRLGMMLQRLQPRIAGSGVDMSHLLGIVREIQPAAGTGTRAIMMVGNILMRIQSPSQGAATALAALGVQLRNSKGDFIGLEPAVEKLRGAYEKLPATLEHSRIGHRLLADQQLLAKLAADNQTKAIKLHEEALKKEIAAITAQGGALTRATFLQMMFGSQANIAKSLIEGGSAGIEANTKALTANGTAADAAALKMQDAKAQMEALPKTLETISESIGMVLLPALNRILTPILGVVTAVASWVVQNPEVATGILAVVGAVGALGAVLAFAGPALGAAFAVLTGVVAPVLVLVGGIGMLVHTFMGIPSVMEPVNKLFIVLQNAVSTVAPFFASFVRSIGDLISGKADVSAVGSAFLGMLGALGGVGGQVLGALGGVGGAITSWVAAQVPVWASALPAWTATILAWVADAVRALVGELTSFVGPILGWVASQIPTWATALADWTGAFLDWVAGAVPALISGLLAFVDPIIRWVADQVPIWANALLAWTGAFLNWALGLGGVLLGQLPALFDSVVRWVGDQVGPLGTALVGWAGAFADWVVKNAVPAATTALNSLINAIVSWIDSGAVLQITAALVTWIVPFVGWAAGAAVQAVAGFVLWLGSELVTKGPQIALAALSAGSQILVGIAAGLLSDPGAIVAAITALLGAAAIFEAVGAAGRAAGLVYAGAVEVLNTLTDIIIGIWNDLVEAVAEAVGAAGTTHGIIYTLAAKAATTVLVFLQGIWATIAGSPEPAIAGAANGAEYTGAITSEMAATAPEAGAVFGAEFLAGANTALAAGFGAAEVEGAAFGGSWAAGAEGAMTTALAGMEVEAAAAGTLAGLSAGAAIAAALFAAVGAVILYVPIHWVMDAIIPPSIAKPGELPSKGGVTVDLPGFTSGDLVPQAQATGKSYIENVMDSIIGMTPTLVTTMTDAMRNAAQGARTGLASWVSIGIAAISALSPVNRAVKAAGDAAAHTAASIPQQIHDALVKGESLVQSGITALHTAEHLKADLLHAAEVSAVALAVAAGKSPTAALTAMGLHGKALAAALADPQIKEAQALGAEIAKDLRNSDPNVSGAARDLLAQITAQAALTQSQMANYGKNTANAWVAGITSTAASAKTAIDKYISHVAGGMIGFSPPRVGPLRDIVEYGANIGELFGAGLAGTAASVAAAARSVTGAAATPMMAAPVAAISRAPAIHVTSGGTVIHVHNYLNGREIGNTISRQIFEEERQYGGPSEAGSPY